MNRRFLSNLLVVATLGGQLLNAQAPTAASNGANGNTQAPANADALGQLRAQISRQQEQIKKLQQAVDEQQKMLEQTMLQQSMAQQTAAAKADGTTLVAAAYNGGAPVALVPAISIKRHDVVNMPRYMQEGPKSPLSISIGNSTFTPFGFIDAIAYGRSTNPGSGIGSSFTGIPYNNAITGHIGETNITLQNSRVGFRVDSEYKDMKVLGYFEMDFLGNQPTSIYQTSNSDTFRMRNVFVDVNKGKFEFLGGQDWSFATPNRKGLSPLPSDVFFSQAVDTNYQAGLVWARQGQFRFVYHPSDNLAMGVSFENPQQFIGGGVSLPAAYSTQLANQLNTGSTTYTAPSVFPDVIAKVAADSKIFHIEAAGLVRQFKVDTSAGTPVAYSLHSATGVAGEVNFNVNLASKFRLIANTYFGDGGGRYIGGVAPDLIVRANGSLAPVHSYSTTDGFEYNPAKKLMLYSYYSGVAISRDTALDANGKLIGYGFQGSALSNNKTVQEFTFGIAPTFYKNANYGALGMNLQYSYLLRDPWSVPAAGPKDAHLNLFYIDLRYTLP
jgi:hypothetical protein